MTCRRLSLLLAAAGIVASWSSDAISESSSSSDANMQEAYHTAIKCMITNYHFSALFKDAGDKANSQLFQDRSEKSFKSAYGFAHFLGIPNSKVDKDMSAAQIPELKKLMTNKKYELYMISFCKRHGHME